MTEKKNFSPEEQLQMVETSPYNIRFIANPTEQIQMRAVTQCWQVIKLIDQPSPKVRLLIP